MDFTQAEEQALAYGNELLVDRQHQPSVQAPYQDGQIFALMDSPKEDLATLACYVADRLDDSESLAWLTRTPTSAQNLARMIDAWDDDPRLIQRAANSPDLTTALQAFKQLNLPGPLLQSSTATTTPTQTIIIHGTWAKRYDWWLPTGAFFQYIDGITKDVYKGGHPFWWSGRNRHSDRINAAHDLVQWTANNPTNSLRIIAHSHGGNVVLHAATRLGLKVDQLIMLGTPIRLEYMHNTGNITDLHSVFSLKDHVQAPAGATPNPRGEGRTLIENSYTTNHIALDDGQGKDIAPDHSELHEEKTWVASKIKDLL